MSQHLPSTNNFMKDCKMTAQNLNLEVTVEEAQQILNALGTLPYSAVQSIIPKLLGQTRVQMQEPPAPAPAAPEPAPAPVRKTRKRKAAAIVEEIASEPVQEIAAE